VGSALTETENWDLLVDCTSRDGRQMLDAGVHLSDKRTLNDHVRGFFLFLIYQEQAIGLSFKKTMVYLEIASLCPLKLICLIKDVFLDICTSCSPI
jgi:hypothetical protein